MPETTTYKALKQGLPYSYALAILMAAHIAGFIGLQTPFTRPLFLQLVPFNLILTAFLLFSFHRDWSRSFFLFAALAFALGYLTELAGVHTGLIFGKYTYGSALGVKLYQVPLLIGLNWLVLIYSIGILCQPLQVSTRFKAATGSVLMVLLDVFIEQVAIRNDFWAWQSPAIPLQNYIGWFITSYLLFMLFYKLPFIKSNPLARPVYLVQLSFFISFCILYLLRKEIILFA